MRRGLICHYQPCSGRGGLRSGEPEQAGEDHTLTESRRISLCELDVDFCVRVVPCISIDPFHILACSLSCQTAGCCREYCYQEGAVSSECERFWNCWNQCVVVGPRKCSQFGLVPEDL